MQIRLTKENLIALNFIGVSTQKEVNDRIRDTLLGEADVKQMGSNQPQLDLSSLLPFLSSIEESLTVMACASGRVGQRTLNESSEQPLMGGVVDSTKSNTTLTEAQLKWIGDLSDKAIGSLTEDNDRMSGSQSTRNFKELYSNTKHPPEFYEEVSNRVQNRILSMGVDIYKFKF